MYLQQADTSTLCMFQCLLSSDNGKVLDEKGGIFFFFGKSA